MQGLQGYSENLKVPPGPPAQKKTPKMQKFKTYFFWSAAGSLKKTMIPLQTLQLLDPGLPLPHAHELPRASTELS